MCINKIVNWLWTKFIIDAFDDNLTENNLVIVLLTEFCTQVTESEHPTSNVEMRVIGYNAAWSQPGHIVDCFLLAFVQRTRVRQQFGWWQKVVQQTVWLLHASDTCGQWIDSTNVWAYYITKRIILAGIMMIPFGQRSLSSIGSTSIGHRPAKQHANDPPQSQQFQLIYNVS